MTDPEELSDSERTIRRWLIFGYRFVWAIFMSWQLFDFLFNPIWMHGYLWSLNLPVDKDFSDKTAGHILDHQLLKVGRIERVVDSILFVLAVIVVLKICGYSDRNHSVWELLRLSMMLGAFSAMARCTQTKQRMFIVLHDIFFIYLNVFLTGLIMTIGRPEKKVEVSRIEAEESERTDRIDSGSVKEADDKGGQGIEQLDSSRMRSG